MASGDKLLVLWIVFLLQAFVLAFWLSWGTPVVGIALIFALIFGGPLSLLLAVIGRRKRLMFTIVLGTVLIWCSVGVAMLVAGGNPIVIVVLIAVSAGVLWLVAPNAPLGDGYTRCSRCGYSLAGLVTGKRCPECGEVVSRSGKR
jgi:hypothetical protein